MARFQGLTVLPHLNVLVDTEMKDQQLSPENIFFIASRCVGENWIPAPADEFFPRNKIPVCAAAQTHGLHNSAVPTGACEALLIRPIVRTCALSRS
jgi:hypothetical protein